MVYFYQIAHWGVLSFFDKFECDKGKPPEKVGHPEEDPARAMGLGGAKLENLTS